LTFSRLFRRVEFPRRGWSPRPRWPGSPQASGPFLLGLIPMKDSNGLDDWEAIELTHDRTMARAKVQEESGETSRRNSQEIAYRQNRARNQSAIQMALYYKELRKWLSIPNNPRRKPEPPSQSQMPSKKQLWYLNKALGGCSYPEMIRFVEFANGLPSGLGYFPGWQERGSHFLSRVLWIEAIKLAVNDRNHLGSAEYLVTMASEP